LINLGPPHGRSSSVESGVCPNLARYGLEGFLLRLRTAPRSMTMSCSYARPSTSIDPNPINRTSITCHPYPPPARMPRPESRLLPDNLVFRRKIQHFGIYAPCQCAERPCVRASERRP